MKKYRVVMAGRQEGDAEQEFSVQSIFTHDAAGYDDGDIALVKLKACLEKLCTNFFRTRIVLSVLFKKGLNSKEKINSPVSIKRFWLSSFLSRILNLKSSSTILPPFRQSCDR